MYKIYDYDGITLKRQTEDRESARKALYSISRARAKNYGVKPMSVKQIAKIFDVIDTMATGEQFVIKNNALILVKE